MTSSDAQALAQKEAYNLGEGGVTIANLQALKDAMYNSGASGLGLQIVDVRKNIILLAEQHIEPAKLNQMYQLLIGGWWKLPGGLTLPVSVAQPRAVEMARKHAEPQDLRDIYAVLFGYAGGILLPQTQAQQVALETATAGADAPTFQATYAAQTKKGATQDAALKTAKEESIKANLHSLVRRYAKDTNLYTAEEFQKYYGDQWLNEWMVAPFEKRVHREGCYRASEYFEYFGADWFKSWANDSVATQVRIASDGYKYTIAQFYGYYKNDWQTQWAAAAEVACPAPAQDLLMI